MTVKRRLGSPRRLSAPFEEVKVCLQIPKLDPSAPHFIRSRTLVRTLTRVQRPSGAFDRTGWSTSNTTSGRLRRNAPPPCTRGRHTKYRTRTGTPGSNETYVAQPFRHCMTSQKLT